MTKKDTHKENHDNSGKKPGFKAWKIALIVVAALIIIIAGAFIYLNSRLGLDTKDAILYPESSASVIRSGNTLSVSSEYALKEKDTIVTQDSGARIYLYESVFVTVEPNSKVTIENLDKDDIQIRQEEGRTYSKITNVLGVSKYTLLTPGGDVAVHGTGFEVYVIDNESTVIVSDGEVVFSSGEQSVTLGMLEKAVADGNAIQKTELTSEERARLISQLENSIDMLKSRRYDVTVEFVDDNAALVNQLENSFEVDINEQTIGKFYADVDAGNIDVADLKRQAEDSVPLLNTEFIEYVESMSSEAERQQAILAQMRQTSQ